MSIMKQRHLILYHTSFGRNDGAPLYYYNCLKNQLNINIKHLAPQGDISNFGDFDYTRGVDYGEDVLPVDHEWEIPKNCGKTIYVASDTHLDNGYRLKKAEKFDYVFFNQKSAVDEYNKTHENKAMWLPHAAEPQAYPKIEIIKKYDVGFVGHHQDTKNYNGFTRTDALDRLFKEFPNFYYGSRHPGFPEKNLFEDAAKKFSLSKVAFNISIGDDINMRVFETLSTGSFLLTNWIPTLEYIFDDGKHLVTYSTLDEMVELVKYYLEHDDEREAIAKAGYEEFINNHTYRHRVEKILKTVSK